MIQRIPKHLLELDGTQADITPVEPQPLFALAGCQPDETWSGTNCTVEADATDYRHGCQSQKIAVNSGATAVASCTLRPIAHYMEEFKKVRGNIGVLLKVDDLAKVDHIYVDIDEDGSGNGYKGALYHRTASPVNRFFLSADTWATCWLQRDKMVAGGDPTPWGTGAIGSVDEYPVARIRLEIVAASGQSPVVHLGAVLSQRFPKAGFVFVFDDGTVPALDVTLPSLQGYGWAGCSGIVAEWEGWPSPPPYKTAMNVAQLQQLYDAGWDLLPHGYSSGASGGHVELLSTATEAFTMGEVESAIRYLEAHGWFRGSRFYMPAGGTADNQQHTMPTVLARCGVLAARFTHHRSAEPPEDMTNRSNCWLPEDIYNLSCGTLASDIGDIEEMIDRNVRDRHLLLLNGHDVGDSPSPDGMTTAKLRAVCDLIKPYETQGVAEVLTLSRWYNRILKLYPLYLRSRSAR